MKCERLNYYLLNDKGLLAKGLYFDNWIYDFEHREWVKDKKCIISDALMGYDPGEPEGSPYGIGSTSVMDEVKHISYETAMQIISDMIVQDLLENWHFKYEGAKAEWDATSRKHAKPVVLTFCLFGTLYTIKPKDFGWKEGPSDDGFLKSIQKELKKDLKKAGAIDIGILNDLDSEE